MPFQWRVKQLGGILRGREVSRCLVVASACPAAAATRALVEASLEKASIGFSVHCMQDEEWPSAAAVDGLAREARAGGAQAVVGVGADGVLDAAKATALVTNLLDAGQSVERFLGAGLDGAAPTCSRLPMVAVVTRPTLAGCSGRCLLWNDDQLVPLRIAGTGSHAGIGPGLPPTVAIVDHEHALGFRATRTGLTHEQHNLGVGASALAAIVDMRLATASTIKAAMLEDASAVGVTAVRSVLADPVHCAIDGLLATRVAAIACLDSDATAYAKASTIHALACAAAGALPPSPARAARCLPYSSLAAAFLPAVLRAVARSGSEEERAAIASLAAEVLPSTAVGVAAGGGQEALELAEYLESRYLELSMPTVRQLLQGGDSTAQQGGDSSTRSGEPEPQPQFVANLIAISVWNHALVRRNGARALPVWFADVDRILAVVRVAVGDADAAVESGGGSGGGKWENVAVDESSSRRPIHNR